MIASSSVFWDDSQNIARDGSAAAIHQPGYRHSPDSALHSTALHYLEADGNRKQEKS